MSASARHAAAGCCQGFPADALVVLAGQSVGHHTDQLLPGSLAFGSEILAEVGSQDDDQDVTQELGGQEHPQVSNAQEPADPHASTRIRPRETSGHFVGLKISLESFFRYTLNLFSALTLKIQVLLLLGEK